MKEIKTPNRRALSFANLALLARPKPGAGAARKTVAPSAASAIEHDSKDEMHGCSLVATARRRERARCAAIFASPAAAAHLALAANLAFKTRMTRGDAVALLEASVGESTASVPAAAKQASGGLDRALKAAAQRRR